jgi:type I restriction enzyme S subunit
MTSKNWPVVTIGDIAKVKGGKRLPLGQTVQDAKTAHPYIRVTDFHGGVLDTTNVKYITDETFERVRRYTITSDDVFISIAGTIGLIGIVPVEFSGSNLTENAAKLTDIDKSVDHRFLAYYLQGPPGQAQIQSKTVGTSQPKLALFRIGEIEVALPPLPTQRKIADILSAYDDLIENNTRRIELLEEMAQAIYREWFVHFRFPGHEQVAMVETELGVAPEGWEVKPLGDALELAYGKGLKADDRREGQVPVYGSSGVVGYHDLSLVKGPGIIVGRKGNVGSVFWCDVDFFPIDTTYFVVTSIPLRYVYFNLQYQHFINNDAAVPGLSRAQAYLLPFLVPAKSVLAQFDSIVAPVFDLVKNLTSKNANLRRTRDLLLPRLVSGEVEVSGV